MECSIERRLGQAVFYPSLKKTLACLARGGFGLPENLLISTF
jgi:hypothetical protein